MPPRPPPRPRPGSVPSPVQDPAQACVRAKMRFRRPPAPPVLHVRVEFRSRALPKCRRIFQKSFWPKFALRVRTVRLWFAEPRFLERSEKIDIADTPFRAKRPWESVPVATPLPPPDTAARQTAPSTG